jgi:hypothetical protein
MEKPNSITLNLLIFLKKKQHAAFKKDKGKMDRKHEILVCIQKFG